MQFLDLKKDQVLKFNSLHVSGHSAEKETSQRPPKPQTSHRSAPREPPPRPPALLPKTSVVQADVELHKGWLKLMTTGFTTPSSKGVVVVLFVNKLIIYNDYTNFEVSKNF